MQIPFLKFKMRVSTNINHLSDIEEIYFEQI